MYLIQLLAITELPCQTDGFAGNYDDYQTTLCNTETQTNIPAVYPNPETTSKFNLIISFSISCLKAIVYYFISL